VGGNIFIRKHQILNDPKNRSNKFNQSTCSETSSDNNSSENNSSENELDLVPTLLKPSLKQLMPKLENYRRLVFFFDYFYDYFKNEYKRE